MWRQKQRLLVLGHVVSENGGEWLSFEKDKKIEKGKGCGEAKSSDGEVETMEKRVVGMMREEETWEKG